MRRPFTRSSISVSITAASPAATATSAALIRSLSRLPLATWRKSLSFVLALVPHAAFRFVRGALPPGANFGLQFHRLVAIQIKIRFLAGRFNVCFVLRRRAALAKLTTPAATSTATPATSSAIASRTFLAAGFFAARRTTQSKV
jgi:hypothetical protein